MPESRKYLQSGELSALKVSSVKGSSSTVDTLGGLHKAPMNQATEADLTIDARLSGPSLRAYPAAPSRNVRMKTFLVYFSEWRHLKTLIGTALSWFLLDIAFYGLNLNQSVLLSAIGFAKGKTEYETLLKNGYGNLIIAAAGYVPGYFFTIYFIEILGRRWIQIQGFIVCALMFGIIAGDYAHLGTAGKFVCFTIAQVTSPYHLFRPLI